jgi:hypothetical protein
VGTENQETWVVRRDDDSTVVAWFPTKQEAWAFVHSRTMPWEFSVYGREEDEINNVSQAIEWSNRLSDLSLVRATLIGILARREDTELEGGWREALAAHPLMQRIEAEKAVLEEQILLLV